MAGGRQLFSPAYLSARKEKRELWVPARNMKEHPA